MTLLRFKELILFYQGLVEYVYPSKTVLIMILMRLKICLAMRRLLPHVWEAQ